MKIIEKILDEIQEHLDQEILDVEKETISDVGVGIEICMNIVKEIAKESRCKEITEQKYKELAAAVKESGIPLDMQQELQCLIEEKIKREERRKKLSPMSKDPIEWQQLPEPYEESCTGATEI